MENEDKLKEFMLKEIEIIQDIIRRMGFNSFMIKGWAITLVVVPLLLRETEYQVWIAFIPLLVFGFQMHTSYGRNGCIENCMNGLPITG